MAFLTGFPLRRLVLLGLLGAAGLAACSEDLETEGTCPVLCPEQGIEARSTVIEPFSRDTTIIGIPLLGGLSQTLAMRMGDTVDTRPIVRFDVVPRYFRPSTASSDSTPITELTEAYVELLLNRVGSSVTEPVTLEAYDVSGPGDDTAAAVLAPRFVPERLMGTVVVSPRPADDTTTVDSVRIQLDRARLLAILGTEDAPVRLGFRVTGADARLRFLRDSPNRTRLFYDASADTTVGAFNIGPNSATPADDDEARFDQREFTLVVRGAPGTPDDGFLTVGGLPSRRVLLQFDVPRSIVDSASIVRATLDLVQVPVRGYPELDTLVLLPRPVIAGQSVTDPLRLTQLSGNPFEGTGAEFSPIDSLRLSPADSGVKSLELAELFSYWRLNIPGTPQRAIVLRAQNEGVTPLAVRFFGSDAPDESVRPRLRISYIPRVPFGVP